MDVSEIQISADCDAWIAAGEYESQVEDYDLDVQNDIGFVTCLLLEAESETVRRQLLHVRRKAPVWVVEGVDSSVT